MDRRSVHQDKERSAKHTSFVIWARKSNGATDQKGKKKLRLIKGKNECSYPKGGG